jgi:hypothetical protein
MSPQTKRWMLIGGVGAAAIVFYLVYKSRKSSGASAQAAEGIDPATGVPYASEQYSGAYGTTPSLYGYTDPSTGAFISGVGAGGGSGGYVTAPSTNASWAQQVEAYLMNLGYDPIETAAALGKYLTGQGLTSDQAAIVAAAKGFFGNPPQGAPPSVLIPPGGQTGTSGQPPTTTTSTVDKLKKLIVPRNMSFAEMAREWNWNPQTIAAIMHLNSISADSQLRKGEVLIRPLPIGAKQYNLPY